MSIKNWRRDSATFVRVHRTVEKEVNSYENDEYDPIEWATENIVVNSSK